jgi:RNase H-fold protein (predicted Holliday junction resolvase)
MKSQSETTLGISIGTNTVGLVLVRYKTLVDWQVKTFHGEWSRNKEQIIVNTITKYIRQNHVTTIALKFPESSRSSMAIKSLIRLLQKHCSQKGIKVHSVGINVIKAVTETKNKKELTVYLVRKYPELRTMYERQEKSKNDYYLKMFEAVGAAFVCI